jgi:hypothetical protein
LVAAEERTRVADERVAQRQADQRAQASRVTAWFEQYYMNTGEGLPPDVAPTHPATWGAAIRNASDLAVLDVRVFFYFVNDPGDGGPWTAEQRWASTSRIRQVPPGQIRHMELPESIGNMVEECNDQLYLVGIEFTDANGLRWMRDERGSLHPVGWVLPVQLR